MSVAERSVNRGRFLVTTPGDIRSENADMSNEKSCEKHDRLPVEGFLRSVNLRRVNWMRVRSRSRREMIKRTTKSDQINKSTPNPKRKTMGRKELTRQKPSRYAGRCEINRCWSSYNCSIALAGAAAGIGNALRSLIHSVARNPF